MKFFTRFDAPEGSKIDQTGQKSKTRQSEADACDINKIMERFNRTGRLPMMQSVPPQYGDARVVDYQTAQNLIKDAKKQFLTLPAKVRKAFGNDPQAFLSALGDNSPENAKRLLELGVLVKAKETPEEMLQRIADNTNPVEKAATE